MDDEFRQILSDKLLSLSESLDKLFTDLENICIEIKTLNQHISHSKTLDEYFLKTENINPSKPNHNKKSSGE